MKCPHCNRIFAASLRDLAGELGASKSPAKAKSSRANGKRGGRPKKATNEQRTNSANETVSTVGDGKPV